MNISLFLHKIQTALQKRSNVNNNRKSYAAWLSKGYINKPLISFIIQSHNKCAEVKHIVSKLRAIQNSEIIVIDDGSAINHLTAISDFMQKANEFVIRANDLYENVMYDKAIRFSNGRFIALLQDDDDFTDLSWIDKATGYFSKYPKLAILGGYEGFNFDIIGTDEAHDMPYKEQLNKDFSFVHIVNRAPMWLNRELFDEKLKHIDFDFAPFQYDDCELCLRAWINGLQVGWYNAGFKSLSSGGMRIWNTSFTQEQCIRNQKTLYQLYHDKKHIIDEKVYNAVRTLDEKK